MSNTPLCLLVPGPLILMALPMALLLVACAPTSNKASSAPTTGVTAAPPTPASQAEPAETPPTNTPEVRPAGARISGAIRDGNRAPPALRICATPVDGGTPTCMETAEGALDYRIDVAPGRYYLLGWVGSGALTLIAHASQIRCISAPCPPDTLIEVGVTAGQQLDGIDLNGGYVDIPEGWPKRTF